MVNGPVILLHSGKPEDDPKIRATILERFPDVTVHLAPTEEALHAVIPETEILFAWHFPVELLPKFEKLRWFQIMGAGVDKIAAGPRLPPHVQITNLRGVFGPAMAEYAIAYMLAHLQDVRRILQAQAERRWEPFRPGRLEGKTVGVIGLGSIGREIVNRCAALGMRVVGVKREPSDVPNVERVYTIDQIDQVLPQVDFLVIVVPQTAATTGLLSRDRLQFLKRSCFLVNIGRGNVAREEDLAEALRERWIAGAALDVFPVEPLPAESPLWELDNLYLTPHMSGPNQPHEVVRVFLDNLDRYLRGEPLVNYVDLDRGY
ncbi:MAG: D-2-hydroxyacid dehydrogenase [Chloroflexi bacterium]|nr:D-2-hydroxyacid dehydrogenase [Chloroflexota bacterium]